MEGLINGQANTSSKIGIKETLSGIITSIFHCNLNSIQGGQNISYNIKQIISKLDARKVAENELLKLADKWLVVSPYKNDDPHAKYEVQTGS